MAKANEVPKSTPADSAKSSPADASTASLNKAQIEYQHYLNRMKGQQPGSVPAFMVPMAVPAGSEAMPGWAVPPSVAMLAHASGSPGFFAAVPHGGAPGQSTLTSGLGSTFRLGVDVINAALAGSVRLLNGISGGAYGYGEPGYGHHGCGCHASFDCCGDDCCGDDCCGCECCRPGVGTCC